MTEKILLENLLGSNPEPFAVLHRPQDNGVERLEILRLHPQIASRLADIPLPDSTCHDGTKCHEMLVLVPHQQVSERGFDVKHDDSPLIALSIRERRDISMSDVLDIFPNANISFSDAEFDIDDEDYAHLVRTVLNEEIGRGEGSNFVIKRCFVAEIAHNAASTALTLFRRLLLCEVGAYWTFVVYTGSRFLVGATPERHVTLYDGVATMNPISGTYRYPPSGPDLSGLLDFLLDQKETDELYMVVDEEMKMMARVCPSGARAVGPFLREMASLAHTEYFIEGYTTLDPRDILRETLLAPTVTGSPLENACRVITRHELRGRGYYGGVLALIGRQSDGKRWMDSAILIRMADIARSESGDQWNLKIGVGSTLVLHSDPVSEVAETRSKVAGLLKALSGDSVRGTGARCPQRLAHHPVVAEALRRRNERISSFWLEDPELRRAPHPDLHRLRAVIVDAEDTFTAMLAAQLSAIGLEVRVSRFDTAFAMDDYDLVVMGPGPGDPRDEEHSRIACMYSTIERLLACRKTFFAVCLSHQLLCRRLGVELKRLDIPNQGVQCEVDLFGVSRRIGFYNSFSAFLCADCFSSPEAGEVLVSRNASTGEVHALKGTHFASVQGHIESVLTQDALGILTDLLLPLVASVPKESLFV
ncbi:phenazine-specific anthranilate synthase [Nostoc parmelioides FACHB-3921]|uniref:anthranilate synthase n=1 Tax=Nostoc parmelioides FACHB-3921 TaxID=2692909 RepID=A0ABR8BQ22_9NOSO|nr:anthranilate synthase family protein [Nostoc parmelioides]MBD2255419.1 phenazine-specific anthranilate synthase [Nostoc parmelioides FACHB-3921]